MQTSTIGHSSSSFLPGRFSRSLVAACGLATLCAALGGAPATDEPGSKYGVSAAYATLGKVAVLHRGRVKPLDTMARIEVGDVYGPGDITLKGLGGKKDIKWSAIGALVDWSARPDYWDQQEIILIDLWDYRPFKQELLVEPIKRSLAPLIAKTGVSAEARQALEALVKRDTISEKDLDAVLSKKVLDPAAKEVVETWATRLAEGHKRVSPAALEAAVFKVGDRTLSFDEYFREVYPKGAEAEASEGQIKLPPREEFVYVIGKRLKKYEGYRDKNPLAAPQMDFPIAPRPSSEAYIKYTGALIQDLVDAGKPHDHTEGDDHKHPKEASEFGRDSLNALGGYLESYTKAETYMSNVVSGKEKLPGQDAKFDRSFGIWLREASNWIPLRLLLETDTDELARAGVPTDKVLALRSAYEGLESAERSSPGTMNPAAAEAFAKATRELGTATGPTKYPTVAAMDRESHFNTLNPFGRAPWAFGVSLVLLLVSLGVSARSGSALARFDRVLYWGGVLGLIAGIALEIYGFYLRINISGWAPVTNMYETVIWVALGAAVLGLILEAIFRHKYAATAASGIALVATLLAANVPLLEPNIGQLSPVLRDNFWLTVHVLTIVSSYAAFSLVMGLGLLGIAYYLSATYRRDASYRALAGPALVGAPLVLLGLAFYAAIQSKVLPLPLSPVEAGWIATGLVGPGAFLCVMGLFAVIGEFSNRQARVSGMIGLALALVGGATAYLVAEKTPPAGWPAELPLWFLPGVVCVCGAAQVILSGLGNRSRRVLVEAQADAAVRPAAVTAAQPVAVAVGGSGGGGAISVAERVKMTSKPLSLDPRGTAIAATVSQIKPLSNFIYRAMQVGVLLVALGTFLGGVWADKSWGRFWGWDPKEVWALITLLVYLIPLHGRFAGWVSTFGLVAASVICYNSVLMAWYGVNWVLGVGLHSYGFTEGGGQGVVVSSALALIAIVLGAWWRRKQGSSAVAMA